MILAAIVFKILNFLVVIGLFVYVIRRYGILHIIMMMRKEKTEHQALKDQLKILQVDCKEIDDDIVKQEQLYAMMQDKFQIWQMQIKRTNEKEQNRFQIRQKKNEENNVVKIKSLQQRRLMKKEFPALIKEVSEDLKNSFAIEEHQRKYISKLILFLEESNI